MKFQDCAFCFGLKSITFWIASLSQKSERTKYTFRPHQTVPGHYDNSFLDIVLPNSMNCLENWLNWIHFLLIPTIIIKSNRNTNLRDTGHNYKYNMLHVFKNNRVHYLSPFILKCWTLHSILGIVMNLCSECGRGTILTQFWQRL